MAVVQTGSAIDFTGVLASTNTGTVSTTITVPADAQLVVVGWSGYENSQTNLFSGGGFTFTKGGVDTAMTVVSGGADASTSFWMAGLCYLVLPDTGANKTLKWDFAGVTSVDGSILCSVTFWKGLDTASPVRGSGGNQGSGLPLATSAAVTALSGDLILAWLGFNASAEAAISTWSNATTLSQVARDGRSLGADAAWATGSPSGNVTVSATASTGGTYSDGGILAISLKPAPVSGLVPSLLLPKLPTLRPWLLGQIPAVDMGPGIPPVTGTLATTEASDIAAFVGDYVVQGPLVTTEAQDTAAFNASYAVTGTLAATEATDTASFIGALPAGTLAATEDPDVAAFNATYAVTGTLATTEAQDTAAFLGSYAVVGTLAATEVADVAAFVGNTVVSGTLAATEATDTAAFNATFAITGTLAATEAQDVAAFNATYAVTGTLAATEAADIAAFLATYVVNGTLAATEAADIAAFNATYAVKGTLAATEAADIAAFNATFAITGTLAATEATDTASFIGSGVTPSGTLAATETPDTAAFNASYAVRGPLVTTEAPDLAAFTASFIVVTGTLAAVETPDAAAFAGNVVVPAVTGYLAAIEAQDVAQFAGVGPPVDIGPLNFGIRKVISKRW